MQPLAELDSIESDAVVAKSKLDLCRKLIENNTRGQIKARLAAKGNVLFDKHMSLRRDPALHNRWSPVASTAEARLFPARAASYGRVTENIDLIAAYPQVMLGGNTKHYMISPECLRRVMPPKRESDVRQTATSCVRAEELYTVSPGLSRFHHELRQLVDHEVVAHSSRSNSLACVAARR